MSRRLAAAIASILLTSCQAAVPIQIPQAKEWTDAAWATHFGVTQASPSSRAGTPVPVVVPQEITPGVTVAVPPGWAPPPAETVCEFPVQSVKLERQVLITNTPPQITEVKTDVCGNVIAYTETMTRNLTASPWTPVTRSGAAAETFKPPGKEQYGTIEFQPQTQDYTITVQAQRGERLHQLTLRSNVQRLDPLVAKRVVESLELR